MAMSEAQVQAFSSASGGLDVSVLSLVCTGGLIATLFVWAAWALVDVWQGWSHEKVRRGVLTHFTVRLILLLLISTWMFAS